MLRLPLVPLADAHDDAVRAALAAAGALARDGDRRVARRSDIEALARDAGGRRRFRPTRERSIEALLDALERGDGARRRARTRTARGARCRG